MKKYNIDVTVIVLVISIKTLKKNSIYYRLLIHNIYDMRTCINIIVPTY